MLRNPAYAGAAVFGKTQVQLESAGLNRRSRLEGRAIPRPVKTIARPREEWIAIPPADAATTEKIYYYRCLSSDDYRYEGGRVCTGAWNRPAPQTQPATNAPAWKPVPLRMRYSNGCSCPGSRRA